MSHPLDGAFAKIGHADKHLNELEAEIASTPYDADAIRFRQKFHPDTSTIEITLENVPELPVQWGLIAADVLHNLRAALNYVAWELARTRLAALGEDREPVHLTQFPISYKVWKGVDGRQVADLDPANIRRIEAIQPNGAMHLAQFPEHLLRLAENPRVFTNSHLLTHLAVLTNDDKHRILVPVALAAGETRIGPYEGVGCLVTHVNHFAQVQLQNGAKWAEIQVAPEGGTEPKVKVNDRVDKVRIQFGATWTPATEPRRIHDMTAHIVAQFWGDLTST